MKIHVRSGDLLEVELPTGHVVTLNYQDDDDSALPELDIVFYKQEGSVREAENVTVNAWPDHRGKDAAAVVDANQLTIPLDDGRTLER
jgi:hypothetical protein